MNSIGPNAIPKVTLIGLALSFGFCSCIYIYIVLLGGHGMFSEQVGEGVAALPNAGALGLIKVFTYSTGRAAAIL